MSTRSRLLAWRAHDPVHGTIQPVSAEFHERVAKIYDGAVRFWFDVFPVLAVGLENLKAAELIEEHLH